MEHKADGQKHSSCPGRPIHVLVGGLQYVSHVIASAFVSLPLYPLCPSLNLFFAACDVGWNMCSPSGAGLSCSGNG